MKLAFNVLFILGLAMAVLNGLAFILSPNIMSVVGVVCSLLGVVLSNYALSKLDTEE